MPDGFRECDDDPLIGSIQALRAEVNRWIDAEIRARAEPASARPSTSTLMAEAPAVPASTDDPRGRLDALAARLEGRLKQGRTAANAVAAPGGPT